MYCWQIHGFTESSFLHCVQFLSVKCSEMLPSMPIELTLINTDGNARKASWKPDQCWMNGPAWEDFVDSHNLEVRDGMFSKTTTALYVLEQS